MENSARLFLYPTGGSVMPSKPKRPCSYPNCPNLTDGRFCDEHQRVVNKHYEKYQRDPATHKRYGATWRKIRARYVKAHPYCEICYQNGLMKEVEEVHHKIPLSQGGTHDFENLISLCKSCHSRIHAKDGTKWKK